MTLAIDSPLRLIWHSTKTKRNISFMVHRIAVTLWQRWCWGLSNEYFFGRGELVSLINPGFLIQNLTTNMQTISSRIWTGLIGSIFYDDNHCNTVWRCPWCNCYRPRKWTRRHEFKSWTRLIAFHIALIPLGKVWIQLFSLQLWVNSRTD